MREAFKSFLFYLPLVVALMSVVEVVFYWNDPNIRWFAIMAAMGWFLHFDSECTLRHAEEEIDELVEQINAQS
jgi:hypothetical protein